MRLESSSLMILLHMCLQSVPKSMLNVSLHHVLFLHNLATVKCTSKYLRRA